jgi:hypothetical protein
MGSLRVAAPVAGRAPRVRAAQPGLQRLPRARVALMCIAVASLGACTDQQKVREGEMAELLVQLAGRYDNSGQVRADVQHGVRPPHDALAIVLVPVDNPGIGEHMFYVQEMAADDPNRVMVQRVWTFGVQDKRIVQSVWTLKEPLRWRDAQRNPETLESMVNVDVSPVRGCNITWKKAGEKFTGANDPKTCRSTSRLTGGSVRIDTRMEIEGNELSLAETATDAAGQLVEGRTDEPFIRFRKQ